MAAAVESAQPSTLPNGNGSTTANEHRKYHAAETPYSLPNDEDEWERLDVQHYGIKAYFGGNNVGADWPENPRRILEIGAGSGAWAMEVAYQFPNAEVIAIDISDVKPDRKPENCTFKVVNVVKDPWPFAKDEFDIVHCRFVTVHLPNFKELLDKAIDSTAPGGILMFEDIDCDFVSDLMPVPAAIPNFFDIYRTFFASVNVDARPGPKLAPHIMASKKFSETHEYVMPAPMGAWTRDQKLNNVGLAMRKGLVGAGQSQHGKLYKFGMTQEIVDEWAKAVCTPENKLYMDIYFVWAKKKASVV
ncbi:S-adenosyl-L-methionine-dependent methyltransferase [Calocera cornea HHB12733]|uniref:S-adenosyl-L-methionine-dependent methyltransferase n=1 Tax=Calocera cornea HHB12733 TaxID=1353952 RepID=A0A165FFU8_9BASI|nr:S-adenosyl-L-methionine-dependent methyltransferase [Calocera cornea HHB12733]